MRRSMAGGDGSGETMAEHAPVGGRHRWATLVLVLASVALVATSPPMDPEEHDEQAGPLLVLTRAEPSVTLPAVFTIDERDREAEWRQVTYTFEATWRGVPTPDRLLHVRVRGDDREDPRAGDDDLHVDCRDCVGAHALRLELAPATIAAMGPDASVAIAWSGRARVSDPDEDEVHPVALELGQPVGSADATAVSALADGQLEVEAEPSALLGTTLVLARRQDVDLRDVGDDSWIDATGPGDLLVALDDRVEVVAAGTSLAVPTGPACGAACPDRLRVAATDDASWRLASGSSGSVATGSPTTAPVAWSPHVAGRVRTDDGPVRVPLAVVVRTASDDDRLAVPADLVHVEVGVDLRGQDLPAGSRVETVLEVEGLDPRSGSRSVVYDGEEDDPETFPTQARVDCATGCRLDATLVVEAMEGPEPLDVDVAVDWSVRAGVVFPLADVAPPGTGVKVAGR